MQAEAEQRSAEDTYKHASVAWAAAGSDLQVTEEERFMNVKKALNLDKVG